MQRWTKYDGRNMMDEIRWTKYDGRNMIDEI